MESASKENALKYKSNRNGDTANAHLLGRCERGVEFQRLARPTSAPAWVRDFKCAFPGFTVGDTPRWQGLALRVACHSTINRESQDKGNTVASVATLYSGHTPWRSASRKAERGGCDKTKNKKERNNMLVPIALLLGVLWLLGLISGYTLGGAVHVLLVGAIVMMFYGLRVWWRKPV